MSVFDDMVLWNAPLKSVDQRSVIRLNAAMYGNGGVSFASLVPYEYNKVGFLKYNGNFQSNPPAIITDTYGGDIGTNLSAVGLQSPNAVTVEAVDLQDYVLYVNTVKYSELFPYKLANETAVGILGNTPNNMSPVYLSDGVSRVGIIDYPSADHSDYYIVFYVQIYSRPWGSDSPRQLVVGDIFPCIPYVAQGLSYTKQTGYGALKEIATVSGEWLCHTPLAPVFSSGLVSLDSLGEVAFGRRLQTENLYSNLYTKKSGLGDNIKMCGYPSSPIDKFATIGGLTLWGNVGSHGICFKSFDDIRALYADWGITRVTDNADEAKTKPADSFPNPPDLSGDDTIIPDDGESP